MIYKPSKAIMAKLHPRYINGDGGEKLVVLTEEEFESIIEQLEDLDDVRLYNQAKTKDDGTRISLEDAIGMIEGGEE
jgi:PHD/YefM family antitoxin component YafN of YafNO toxin-antitoxin module